MHSKKKKNDTNNKLRANSNSQIAIERFGGLLNVTLKTLTI